MKKVNTAMIDKKRISLAAIFVVIVLTSSSSVFGTLRYTHINRPPRGEKNHRQILSDIYGGTFNKKAGVNYYGSDASAGIQALRVRDYGDETSRLNLLTGTPSDVDKVWTDGVASVTAEAKYAYYNQSFGWNGGGLGTTYYELLTGADIQTQREVTLDIPGDFLWGCHPDSMYWWSSNATNSKNHRHKYKDHMVTYKINGLGGPEAVWLIFMEDSRCGDYDYNDFVVEIRAVPEPTTLCLLGIGGLVTIRRRGK